MADIFYLEQIQQALKNIDPIQFIEDGFIAFSQGRIVVPPVGEILFERPPGEVHIKYGYIKGDQFYVIKIASGFYDNGKYGLPVNNGMMLIFRQKTGELESILLDQGYLTDIRTAAAGAVAAKYLAPKKVEKIGIIGTGVQARVQLGYLKYVTECRDVLVWGRSEDHVNKYIADMAPAGFSIVKAAKRQDIPRQCNLIVTTTPSKNPLLKNDDIREGTHITAVGSDTPEKNELDPQILANSDIFVADSVSQCILRGEIAHGIKSGLIRKETIIELGDIILREELRRQHDGQITVADLTGVAVQDIQITKAVMQALKG